MLGISTIELPRSNGTNYTPDFTMAANLIDDCVKAIVVVIPNHPAGTIDPPATIKELAELCRQRGSSRIRSRLPLHHRWLPLTEPWIILAIQALPINAR